MNLYQLPAINNEEIFQDLICDLFNKLEASNSYKKFGRKGHNQKGIDIYSNEKQTVIQCKKKDLARRDITIKKELLNEIEKEPKEAKERNLKIKFNKFIIASTFKDNPELDEYCEEVMEQNNFLFKIEYWGWDRLSAHIIDYQELIAKYFKGFVIENLQEQKEKRIIRILELKKRFEKDFLKSKPDHYRLRYNPSETMQYGRIIIKSAKDKYYPESDLENEAISSWFRVNMYGLYYNGIEIIVSATYVLFDSEGNWDLLDLNDTRIDKYAKRFIYIIGQIPYSSIIDYDIEGDEYYNEPHIYCHFNHNGEPYENFKYIQVGDWRKEEFSWELDKEKMKTLPLK